MHERTLDRWVASGRLIRVHTGVYAVGHLPTNPIDRAHAALLAGGEGSALAGESALVLWEVWRRWPAEQEVVTVDQRRPVGVRARRCSTLLPRDRAVVSGLRVTSAARTLLDVAPRLSERQLGRAVADLRLRDALRIEQLDDVVARNRTHAGARRLRPLLEAAQPEPTRSVLEDTFLKLLKGSGLPTPEMNVHVAGYRVDALFEAEGLIVELDGWATHRTKAAFARDRRQDADILRLTGMPTVRLTYEEATERGEKTAERLRELLSKRRVRRPG